MTIDRIARALAIELGKGVANRKTFAISRSKYYSGASNGTDIDITHRTKHEALTDCHTLRLVYANFFQDDRVVGLTDYTLNVTVEIGSTIYQAYAGGRTSTVVQLGGIVEFDPIGIDLKKGDTFFVRSHVVVPTGGKFPVGLTTWINNSGEGWADGDQTLATTFTSRGTGFSIAPVMIYATPTDKEFKSLVIVGDSISTGAGHENISVDGHPVGDIGFLQLGAMRAGWGYVTLGMNGQKANDWTQSKRKSRIVWAMDGDVVICNYGTNDLAMDNPVQTVSQIKASLTEVWTSLKKRGLPVYQTTITPHTTSTDGWATVENQTPTRANTAGGSSSARSVINDWIRAGGDGHIDGYIEVADAVETGRNTGLWKPNYTKDGIHPHTIGHNDMAIPIRNLLVSLN